MNTQAIARVASSAFRSLPPPPPRPQATTSRLWVAPPSPRGQSITRRPNHIMYITTCINSRPRPTAGTRLTKLWLLTIDIVKFYRNE